MKAFFSVLAIVTLQLTCFGQAKLSMSKSIIVAPSNTLALSQPFQISAYVKNIGNSSFLGNITVRSRIDSTLNAISGVSSNTTITGTVNLLPNSGDSVLVILSYTPTVVNGFRVAGNGNVIVVWPISGATLLGDSIKTVVYIEGSNGINEYEVIEGLIYPNPSINKIHTNLPYNEIIKTFIIYDVFGKIVREEKYKENIDISTLDNGLYWLILFTENKSYKAKIIKQ